MAKEKILRPESAEVKAMIAEATRIDAGLQEMQNSEKAHRSAAQHAAKALYEDRMREVLEDMDIEHINRGKQGIRVNLLRDNGIENIWQLSQMNQKQLGSIDGLGEQTVRKIQDTVKGIKTTQRTRSVSASGWTIRNRWTRI